MFETHYLAEFIPPNEPLDTTVRKWVHLKQSTEEPWFHIVYTYVGSEEKYLHNRGVMCSFSFYRVLDMINTDAFNVNDLQVVCPAYLNGSNIWKMLLISEVHQGLVDDDTVGYVLTSEQGDSFFIRDDEVSSESDLQNKTLIYKRNDQMTK